MGADTQTLSPRAAIGVTAALSLALLAPLGTSSPAHAAAAAPATAPGAPQPTIRSAARAALGTPTAMMRPLAIARPLSTPTSPCETYPYTDPAHDTASSIDVVAYTLTYDCVASTWRMALTAAQPFASTQVQFLEVDFDTDGKSTNNCDGFEFSEVAEYVPQTGRMYSATIQWIDTCDQHQILASAPAVDRSGGSRSIALTFPGHPLHWEAEVTSFADADGNQWDYFPNAGVLQTLTSGSSAFATSQNPQIDGVFTQVVAGDFNGDGRSDLLEYAAGTAPDDVSFSESSDLTKWVTKPVTISGSYKIIPGDFNGDGKTDLLFYGPGSAADFVWLGSYTGTFKSVPITINGNYTSIVAGDFNGDGNTDLFFYAAGPGTDYLGLSNGDGTFTTTPSPTQINTTYQIAAGDIDGDGRADLVLYAPGTAPDHLLRGQSNGTFTNDSIAINGTYKWIRVGDFNGDGRDDLLLINPDTPPDSLAFGTSSAPFLTAGPATTIAEKYDDAVVGDFTGDGSDDMLLYGAGPMHERTWIGRTAPLTITSPLLPGALPGTPYSFALASTKPSPFQTWSATGLPSGFTIDPSTGTITGQSSTLTTTSVTVSVRDSRGRHASQSYPFNVMPGFAQMSTGYQATCGLTSDGSAYCWGNGELGDLGNGSAANELVPAEVPGLSGLQAIGQAGGTTCVITSRGADKCWGDSYEGEFGDNKAETQSYTPVQVSGLTSGVQSISMGFGGANCALLAGGAARCWGQNTNGEVGNGTTAPQNTPVTVSGLSSGVTSIAAGGDHTCAVKSAAVWCWGAGATLGNGTSNASSVPVAVSGLTSGVVSVVAGESHTCALTSGGAVWCWGHDGTGQLGIDQIGNPVLVPTEVIGLDHGVTALDLGDHNSCATKSDGTLWCWGGTVGVGIKTYPTPVLVGGVAPGATMLSTDGDHTCVGSQVAMQCLGQQFDGDLGDGVDGNGTPPAPVAPQFSWG